MRASRGRAAVSSDACVDGGTGAGLPLSSSSSSSKRAGATRGATVQQLCKQSSCLRRRPCTRNCCVPAAWKTPQTCASCRSIDRWHTTTPTLRNVFAMMSCGQYTVDWTPARRSCRQPWWRSSNSYHHKSWFLSIRRLRSD